MRDSVIYNLLGKPVALIEALDLGSVQLKALPVNSQKEGRHKIVQGGVIHATASVQDVGRISTFRGDGNE